jgi:uncharacterized membrane protein YcjF (UPF0283 family)
MIPTTVSALAAVLADDTTPDPNSVTPGTIGFIMTFAVGIAVVLLIIDMVRRIRRVNYRAQVRQELEAEAAAAAETANEAKALGANSTTVIITPSTTAPAPGDTPER